VSAVQLGTPDATRRRRRRAAVVVLMGACLLTVFVSSRQSWMSKTRPRATAALTERPARVIPDSVRIKVEVINATATRGLGRLATAWLRDKGFDVVATGTAPESERRDSTLVLVRSGRADWGALAAEAMGGARVEARPDSLRYLDLTILVGRVWRAPPQSLYP